MKKSIKQIMKNYEKKIISDKVNITDHVSGAIQL